MTRSRLAGSFITAFYIALSGILAVSPAHGYDGPYPLIFDWTSDPMYYGKKYAHQVSTDTLQIGTYTLTVGVGRSRPNTLSTDADSFAFSLSTADLGGLQSGSPLMTYAGDSTSLTPGAFVDRSLSFVVEPDNDHIGQYLRIDLCTNAGWAFFDNIRLNYQPASGSPITVPIANHSFQSPVCVDGKDAGLTGWIPSVSGFGVWNPEGTYFTGATGNGTPSGADGSQILYMTGGGLRSPNMDQYGFQTVYTQYTGLPFVANQRAWNDPKVLAMYDRTVQENRPLGVTLLETAAPITGTYDPRGLQKTLDYLSSKAYRMDFLNMDFELDGGFPTPRNNAENAEAARQVREHPDPNINQAHIGQFDLYPTSGITYFPYPDQNTQENTDMWNNAYASTGMNMAMPNMYGWEYLEVHTRANYWGSNVAPNKRSALFWAPLEQLSSVKRVLPAGHLLIPYMCDFVPMSSLSGYTDTFDAPTPPHEDSWTLLKHARLRGADGYYLFATLSQNEPIPYDNEEYRGDLFNAWQSLDWLFDGNQPPTILNLATDKQSGLQWSGAFTNRGAVVLISNLGNSAVQFTMPDVPGFNDVMIDTFNIGPGEHRLEYYNYQAASSGRAVSIANHSFQSPARADGLDGSATSWIASASGCGVWNPEEAYFTGAAGDDGIPAGADGTQILYMTGPKYAHQVLAETLQAGIYELTVAVGKAFTLSNDENTFMFSLSTDVLGGPQSGSPLVTYSGVAASLTAGAFADRSLLLVVGPDNVHIGESLRIDLGSAAGWCFFDNIRLNYHALIAGDADGNGAVDARDAAILAANWLSSNGIGWGQGDFNGDGTVNDLDAVILAANWSETVASSHVPEPAVHNLLLALGGLIGWRNILLFFGCTDPYAGKGPEKNNSLF